MGVFGLVNGQWKFFPNIDSARAAGAVDISQQPTLRNTPKRPPPNPGMYWDEMTGQWRFPQPDGSTPGKMPSIGLPGGPGGEIAPFPPGGPPGDFPPPSTIGDKPWYGNPPAGFTQKKGPASMALVEWRNPATGETWTAPNGGWQGPPGWVSGEGGPPMPIDTGPPQWQPGPPSDNIGIPIDGPPQKYPDKPIYDYPTIPEWETKNPFEDYVRKYPDLMEAYKKHKSKGGKGDAASWGKLHFERHGQKEKRKVPGLHGPVTINGTPPPSQNTRPPKYETKPTPNWDKYLTSNPDLMKAFGTDVAKAKQHWSQFGSKEKRKFTPYA